jgi:hypothetical protein
MGTASIVASTSFLTKKRETRMWTVRLQSVNETSTTKICACLGFFHHVFVSKELAGQVSVTRNVQSWHRGELEQHTTNAKITTALFTLLMIINTCCIVKQDFKPLDASELLE